MLKKKKQAAPADETPEDVEEAEEEETTTPPAKRKSSPIRLVLLFLLVIFLLCGGVAILRSRLMGTPPPTTGNPPAGETPTAIAGNPVAGETPATGETPAAGETSVAEQPQPTTEGQLPSTDATAAPEQPQPTTDATAAPEQPQPTTEGQLPVGETPAAEQPQPTTQGEQPTAPEGSEATAVPVDATPVPSGDGSQPTSETPTNSAEGCGTNTPPSAQATGPSEAMMGKGLAVAVFDGTTSSDPDGTIASYSWDFGDNQQDSGESVTHGYAQVGSYAVTLTVTDNCGTASQSSLNVTVTGPTPPAMTETPVATSTVQATPVVTATAVPMPVDGTIGFCHLVRRGQTLYGISAHYDVDWGTLATVNEVWPDYHVRTGQSLFIPTGYINDGPHVYQADDGETLYDIAYQCGLQVGYLADANNMSVDQELTPGQMITIPLWH